MVYDAPPEPRTRRRRANLERILAAASRLVFEEGVDALSVKRVAERADYTAGALYRYFPSKDALLAAVVVRLLAGLEAGLRLADAAAPAEAPLARVVAQADAYRAFSRDEPHGFALVTSMVGDPRVLVGDDGQAAEVRGAVLAALAPLARALADAAARGDTEEGDVAERALTLFAALQGTLQLRKLERRAPGFVNSDRISLALVRALLRGWGAPPAALDAAFALTSPAS